MVVKNSPDHVLLVVSSMVKEAITVFVASPEEVERPLIVIFEELLSKSKRSSKSEKTMSDIEYPHSGV